MREIKEKTPKQLAHLARLGKRHAELWKDPEYRAKMIAKQRTYGYRSYPD